MKKKDIIIVKSPIYDTATCVDLEGWGRGGQDPPVKFKFFKLRYKNMVPKICLGPPRPENSNNRRTPLPWENFLDLRMQISDKGHYVFNIHTENAAEVRPTACPFP